MAEHVVGAQLYTVRQFTHSVEGLVESLKKVADIGYTAVQMSGSEPVDPGEVAGLLERNGLIITSTHESWGRYQNDLDAVIEQNLLWKCRHVGIGGLPAEYRSADGVKRFLEELEPIVEKLNQAGMDFIYHNHNHEFVQYGDKTMMEMLVEGSSPDLLQFEVDVYWVQAGGADPAYWLRRCAGREPVIHLKDMVITPKLEQRFAEVGEGNLNWEAILAAARESGVEGYFVEQDECYDRDPFESLAISYRNLKAMGLS